MKIQVIRCGKVAHSDLLPLVADYRKRLQPFCKTEDIEVKVDPMGRDKRASSKATPPIYQPRTGDYLIALDERGPVLSTSLFAKKIQTMTDDPRIKNLIFLIGPPYGFDETSKKAAHELWSLSPLTIPSDFAWLLAWEQIYRAQTILKGMPYHHV